MLRRLLKLSSICIFAFAFERSSCGTEYTHRYEDAKIHSDRGVRNGGQVGQLELFRSGFASPRVGRLMPCVEHSAPHSLPHICLAPAGSALPRERHALCEKALLSHVSSIRVLFSLPKDLNLWRCTPAVQNERAWNPTSRNGRLCVQRGLGVAPSYDSWLQHA
ncbi:hypothetical protein C8Q70DRAFT_281040 [Cubamyces menziesii]|nr:hypothetical protein C8Q70DRAFT_281040 [Cubamyces menziesii]